MFEIPEIIKLTELPILVDRVVTELKVDSDPQFKEDLHQISEYVVSLNRERLNEGWSWTGSRVLVLAQIIKVRCPEHARVQLLDHLFKIFPLVGYLNSDATLNFKTGEISCDWDYILSFLSTK
jgi:hypothetical protein